MTCVVSGTGAVVISPTRELALQIYGVCRVRQFTKVVDLSELVQDLCKYHSLTHGLVIGGVNRKVPMAVASLKVSHPITVVLDAGRGRASGQGGEHPRLHTRSAAGSPAGPNPLSTRA